MRERDLRTVIKLINEERTYETDLVKKSRYKLLYTIQKLADERDIDISIPYFWYQFGTVSPLPTVGPEPELPDQAKDLKEELRPLVSEALELYYDDRLEGITDIMYRDAPYDVQREFRELDKKVRTHHEDYNDFYEVEPSRESIIDSVYAVHDTFPTVKFREQEQDLSKWYTMFTREVDKTDFDPDKLMKINLTFWRIFALRVAENHRHEMTKQEVKRELEISSFEAARESTRKNLRRMESRTLTEKFEGENRPEPGSVESKAADAMVEPILAQELGVSFSD
jgi:hypothetical protein